MIISTFLASLCVHQINGNFFFQSQPYFMQQYPEEYDVYDMEDPGPYREEVEVTYATVDISPEARADIENLRDDIAALQTQIYSLAATVRTQDEQIKEFDAFKRDHCNYCGEDTEEMGQVEMEESADFTEQNVSPQSHGLPAIYQMVNVHSPLVLPAIYQMVNVHSPLVLPAIYQMVNVHSPLVKDPVEDPTPSNPGVRRWRMYQTTVPGRMYRSWENVPDVVSEEPAEEQSASIDDDTEESSGEEEFYEDNYDENVSGDYIESDTKEGGDAGTEAETSREGQEN